MNKDVILLVVEWDKYLRNVNDFGETQLAAETLACGSENKSSLLFASSLLMFTFYKAIISASYWLELDRGLPQESVKIERWPGEDWFRFSLTRRETKNIGDVSENS
ncbi:10471_t:CDS:2 [Ambispora leptoticha]|uniref:10471_t:CDS:1 n=1 Tax=Ambispora leptoticha TaxID=144679 RepID=A0A9N9HEF6_9GLOM|nr:10471_t:CDS:2 [Ambispora leptoticha]